MKRGYVADLAEIKQHGGKVLLFYDSLFGFTEAHTPTLVIVYED